MGHSKRHWSTRNFQLLDLETLRKHVVYDTTTGFFTRISTGKVCTTNMNNGYITIRINGKSYLAHRLAWLHEYGQMPIKQLDHINRIKSDNRVCNLRECSDKENQQNRNLQINNGSGVRGVHWCNTTNRWVARIRHNKKIVQLGNHKTLFDAACARMSAELKYSWHRTEVQLAVGEIEVTE